MATLRPITIDADGTIDAVIVNDTADTPVWDHGSDAPDGTSSDYIQNDNSETSGVGWFSLENVNGDFSSMTTLNIDVDVWAETAVSDDTITLTARIYDADNDTTNPLTAESGNLGTDADTTRTQRQVAFGTLAGSAAQWNSAFIRLSWTYTKNTGPDNANLRLYGMRITGTYSADGTVEGVVMGSNVGAVAYGSAINWSSPLSRGLVGAWMTGANQHNTRFVMDLTGYNSHGEIKNSWERAWAPVGSRAAIRYDGVATPNGTYVDLGSPVLTATDDWAMSCWAKWSSSETGNRTLCFYMGAGGSNGYGLTLNANTLGRIGTLWGGVSWNDTSTSTTAEEWTHLVATRRSGTLYVYKNGIEIDSSLTSAPNAPATNSFIGVHDTGENFFWGDITDCLAWNRALGPSEPRLLYLDSLSNYPQLLNHMPRFLPTLQVVAGGLSIPIAAYHYNHSLKP